MPEIPLFPVPLSFAWTVSAALKEIDAQIAKLVSVKSTKISVQSPIGGESSTDVDDDGRTVKPVVMPI